MLRKISTLVSIAGALIMATHAAYAAEKPMKPAKITNDNFSKLITFDTDAKYGGSGGWCLHGSVDKSDGSHAIFVVITANYVASDWRNYSSLSDEDANDIQIAPVDHHISSCTSTCIFSETVLGSLSMDYVEKHLDSGFKLKLYSQRGADIIATITPEMIKSADDAFSNIDAQLKAKTENQ